MHWPEVLSLVAELVDVGRRRETAHALAKHLGADDLVIFVLDPEIGLSLPAPGFPQTLPDGRSWQAFLTQCIASGRHAGVLAFHDMLSRKDAIGVATDDGTVLVLLGGEPFSDAISEVRLFLPLLAAAFRGERASVTAAGHAAAERGAAAHAHALAEGLDITRRKLQEALHEADNEIAKRNRAEKALREQREWLHVTLTSIGDAVLTTDTFGRVTFLNGVAQSLTGWAQDEAAGRPLEEVFRIINEHTHQPIENPVKKVLAEGNIVGLANHTVLIAKDGTERVIGDSAAPIRNAQGEVAGVVLVFRDITEHRRSGEALRQSHARFEALFDAAPVGIYLVDAGMRIRHVNPKARPVFGDVERLIGSNFLIGSDFVEVIHILWSPQVADEVVAVFRHTLDTGEPYHNPEFSEERHDSKVREYYDWQMHRIQLPDGQYGVVCYFNDISKQVLARQALAESEEHLRFMAESMPQKIFTAKPNGDVDYFNPQWMAFTGLSFEQIRDWGWRQFIHPDDLAENVRVWQQSIDTGEPFQLEHRFRRADGEYRWHISRALPMRDAQGRITRWIGSNTEVHDVKKIQESLRWSEQTARFLAQASADLAELTDYESTLQKVTSIAVPSFADWCAVDLLDPDGTLRRLAVTHADPAKVKLAQELMERYPPKPDAQHGGPQVARTGKSELVEDIPDSLLATFAHDDEHLRILRQLGLKSYIFVPMQSKGRMLGVLTFVMAETGRRYNSNDLLAAEDLAYRAAVAVENAQLYGALREADRRKDDFLATLAHELRNPLAPLRNALQIMKLSDNGGGAANVREMMERQLQQMVRLVDDLLDVSRITKGKIELRKERLALATVVQSAQEISRPLIETARHELTVNLPSEPLLVDGDLTRLAQVLSNLLNNAAKYTPEGGRIWLTVERDGSEAVMQVRDNGTGIPADMLPRIWEIFTQVDRTLERSQGGLGIGLSLVRRLVEMHGGSVDGFSEGVGRGSTFTVRLPLALVEPVRQQAEGQQAEASGRRRILVVDDNVDSAKTLAMLLQLTGNEVRTAHDGPSALEVAAAYVPDVVLLDIGLPGMSGLDVARRMREMPRLRDTMLIAQTGWGQQEDRRRSEEAGFDAHLVKPVDPAVLMKLLLTDKFVKNV